MKPAEVEEVTPERAVIIAAHEIELAGKADSLEHIRMHLETALIWLRDVPPDVVRAYYPAPVEGVTEPQEGEA